MPAFKEAPAFRRGEHVTDFFLVSLTFKELDALRAGATIELYLDEAVRGRIIVCAAASEAAAVATAEAEYGARARAVGGTKD